ncbi:MAG: esterase [Deltaproteobacteria bacterium]|nr:esterase [Deltaproteobacteria bacterium]MBW2053798.1 esterase [Deltaproteobacteria bacterium]MBW2140020.1 esterase [Deltaproteobacteria bacterium]MBW2324536.1 esterase [Deltaproteobacteria bacterium]
MSASQLIETEAASDLLPGPVEYAVLLPEDYEESEEDFPLLFFLHGGNGSREFLARMRPLIERLQGQGRLPGMVVVTPSVGRSLYMDYRDGTQKWEGFIIGQFLDHLRQTYKVRSDRQGTLLFGISMGGMGALRLGFKYPDLFGGLAALEPGIEPALAFKDIQIQDRFWRADELFEAVFGKPVDEEYWAANNPANIAQRDAEKIRSSKLGVYLECGDEDYFYLYRGTEFLHRILWDHQIPHEYHIVRGANHLGRTVGPRAMEGLEFLGRVVNPPSADDPEIEMLHKMLDPLKKRVNLEV